MHNYLKNHLQSSYISSCQQPPGIRVYTSKYGWQDYYIGPYMICSHRTTTYDMCHFPETLHTHPFFEMTVFFGGNISYIVSDQEIFPQKRSIILIPPGVLHTARLREAGEYDRMVFYFDKKAFQFLGTDGLSSLLHHGEARCFSVGSEFSGQFCYLLEQINHTLRQQENSAALLPFSYILQLFLLIQRHGRTESGCFSRLPVKVLQIKTYIDENYPTISTTAQIADHFFYSREYISRVFKEYFNTTLSEYIMHKRIQEARQALEGGQSVTQAFSRSGYRSMSAFIHAFRTVTGMSPSAYRKQCAKT